MSDQADRLRQLVGARRAAATFTALAEDEPRHAAIAPRIGVAADDSIPALHQRQRRRRDVQPGPEPGDRAGGNGSARRGR